MQLTPLAPVINSIKLIKDLGMELPTTESKNKKRFAIFECPDCASPFRANVTDVKGSTLRAFCRKIIKQGERTAVRKYISQQDWDKPIDYRGMKTTVSYDCH